MVFRSLEDGPRLGIGTIYLSGGEPFLYPRLPEVLTAAARQKAALVVCSNGTLIGPAEADWLKDSGASIQVSLDGPEAYHNHFRGSPEAYGQTCRGIEHLVAAAVPVSVAATISQDNIRWLPALAQWAAARGVGRISIQPLLQLGRGEHIQDKKLTQEQLGDLFLQLSDLGYAYRPRGLRFGLSYRTRSFLLAHPCAAYVCDGTKCHRKVDKEIKKLVIREDGTVLPEIPTLHPRFALGNLSQGSLAELVARYFADGYESFKDFCRGVYQEVMPGWTSPLVPWDEIVSERSWAQVAGDPADKRPEYLEKRQAQGAGLPPG
jgi:MoaA/NifB/PqqE/SkfB family radical SAM enzyme